MNALCHGRYEKVKSITFSCFSFYEEVKFDFSKALRYCIYLASRIRKLAKQGLTPENRFLDLGHNLEIKTHLFGHGLGKI